MVGKKACPPYLAGLFYNYFRDYSPNSGRYIESDPIGLDGGLNTYGYVGGNPLNKIDPLGLDTISLSSTIQIPSFITNYMTGIEGFSGMHSGVAIEFPGPNGGNWDFGGFLGIDVGQTIGSGKFTLNLGYDKNSICSFANTSGEVAALIGAGEFGLSFDPESGNLEGGHVGIGIAPGQLIKFLKNIAKGNEIATMYLNNMVFIGGSVNSKVSSLRSQCGCSK